MSFIVCLLEKQLIMSFLDKFKGRTNQLSQHHIDNILPNSHSTNPPPRFSQNSQQTYQNVRSQNMAKTTAVEHTSKKNQSKQPEQHKSQNKQSPFSVVNPFYLDQLERERDERAKREQEIKQRLQRERKKRIQLELKSVESNKANKDKYASKEWVQLGGLGPNIGTEQWLKKNELHNKMLTFSKEIKKKNFQKIKVIPFVSLSHLHQNEKQNPRTRAIEYSHTVPRPKVVAGQQILERLARSESKEEFSELQRLNLNHLKYVQLMKKM